MVVFQDHVPVPADLLAASKEFIEKKFGSLKPELLAEDFKFRFPIVELDSKAEFVKAFGGFELDSAFPDADSQTVFYNFRLDPVNPRRVWVDTRFKGTHTGKFGQKGPFFYIKPTGKKVESPPQVLSFTFNENLQVSLMTGGYVVDKNEGNTGGLGGVFGLMHAIGHTLPFPEAKPMRLSYRYRILRLFGKVVDYIKDTFFSSPAEPEKKLK
uniref:Uncharacterized protein n=1 Tax=Chromera velia CCMP2878 TaxID=1169474 RepID=A0A0G4HRQ9_9ALVE|mmetsp:Transcript_44240/g.87280  ORF Transcript_44240/g.87280 Transcript_44240/m.87280 type:complete len:212 (-) Transcript_44240:888-1523(-)|eukprot:Cvel_8126.t1-p1 / transcript=Cvel_8126.t1 / gene=Cvel_8126 / organism=Chromera_velia_CCMP2878 / gene_product=hypothetical protein / transcript_product=hypothetical protein / location=Cvel_scaffold442:14282-15848(+) / protein_length=211 / sequence_SO=supercontig / SO=protein_coding / is_pseudo=false